MFGFRIAKIFTISYNIILPFSTFFTIKRYDLAIKNTPYINVRFYPILIKGQNLGGGKMFKALIVDDDRSFRHDLLYKTGHTSWRF